MKGFDVFVLSSLHEGLCTALVDAMAASRAAVATAAGGIPEVLVDGETGYLVPFEQKPAPDFEPRDPQRFAGDLAAAIERVLADAAAARLMGKAGRARVEALFSWESIARRTLALYESLARR